MYHNHGSHGWSILPKRFKSLSLYFKSRSCCDSTNILFIYLLFKVYFGTELFHSVLFQLPAIFSLTWKGAFMNFRGNNWIGTKTSFAATVTAAAARKTIAVTAASAAEVPATASSEWWRTRMRWKGHCQGPLHRFLSPCRWNSVIVQSTLDIVNTICSSILLTILRGSLYREANFKNFLSKVQILFCKKCSLFRDVQYVKYSLYQESTVSNTKIDIHGFGLTVEVGGVGS